MSFCCITNRQRFVMASGLLVLSIIIIYGSLASVHSKVIIEKNNHHQKSDGNNNNKDDDDYKLSLIKSSLSSVSSVSSSLNDPNKELQLVHVVFRHGIRTPADTYPNDPHLNEIFYPVGWGQITNGGKKRLFENGKWLRKRYDNFLGPLYQPEIVHAQSTGVSRTYMSMACVLAGLWPPKDTAMEWNNDLNWQPIPIYSEPLNNDTLLLVRVSCPRYYEALSEVFKKPEIQNVLDNNRPMFEELTAITGMNISTPDDAQSLYSTLLAEEQYGLELPAWTEDYYPDRMKDIVELSYIYNVYTDELKRIKGGPFLKKMLKEWIDKRENTLVPNERKIFLYAGHDSTVANILSALNVWDKQIPVYGIMTLFELYKDINTGEYEVQIFLKNQTDKIYPLTLNGCQFQCPLNKVIEITKNVIPNDDFQSLCASKDPDFPEPPPAGP